MTQLKMNFVIDATPGAWTSTYAEVVPAMFRAAGIDCVLVESSKVATARVPDVWFLAGLYDRCLPDVVKRLDGTQSGLVAHAHGGPEQLGFVDNAANRSMFDAFAKAAPFISAIFVNTIHHGSLLQTYWADRGVELPQLVHSGYPIDVQRFAGLGRGLAANIIVPGRLNYAKQPLLAAQILEPWKNVVTFATGEMFGSGVESEFYADMLRNWGFEVEYLRGDDYVSALKRATVAFTSSMVECACTSMLEAAAAGCICIVPDIAPFDYYAKDNKYPAFDIAAAQAKVSEALSFRRRAMWCGVNFDWYEASAVVARMLSVL